jgi:hypothetical protein
MRQIHYHGHVEIEISENRVTQNLQVHCPSA